MRLLRVTAALLLLQASTALYRAGSGILDTAKAERLGLLPRRHPAERVLFWSIIGMAVCVLWIIAGRAAL
ncbi:hypothetical protein C5748_25750 [Phyllobacterium phragmitis]|uniref:Uncharacterized protein n=1 Tax=Phyllobacterium phragmitis TaxID=2670329 RepID=A0A2S9IJJ5_9HYPH|nr:hypothetical protein [Phyllobacterium phragmitis]PRD40672.1 hypothetical protein C5748_25750 [Phyllobacterium phragmitis]